MLNVYKVGVLIAMIAASLTLNAQAIKIRVINLNNGRPLRNQHVSVALGYEKVQEAPTKYDANLRLETDVNGERCFVFRSPLSPTFLSMFALPPSIGTVVVWPLETRQTWFKKGLCSRQVMSQQDLPQTRSQSPE